MADRKKQEEAEQDDDERDERDGDGDASEGGDEGADEGDEARDEQAARVAKALGVGGGSEDAAPEEAAPEEASGEEEEAKAAPNRAARRRDLALERRRRRIAEKTADTVRAAMEKADDEEEAPRAPLPRDKNLRAKELLKRRRQAAEGGGKPEGDGAAEAQAQGLAAGEMVDDVLARGTDRIVRWAKRNWRGLAGAAGVAALVGVGFLVWRDREEKSLGEAGDALARGTRAERGRILENDQRSQEQKDMDVVATYKSFDERQNAAVAAYREVTAKYAGSGAGILARLGEAGALLDLGKNDEAIAAYDDVSKSKLAAADPDVRARAFEGLGYAKEAKGDLDGALSAFQSLQKVEGNKHWKDLGEYHEARVVLAKGDKEKAKTMLQAVLDRVKIPNKDGTGASEHLKGATQRLLRQIDPSLAPEERSPLIGPGAGIATPEMLRKATQLGMERAQKKAQERAQEHQDHDEPGGEEPK